jgi:hypothetical protein
VHLTAHYQNAYVTADIDRAVELLQREHGLAGEVLRLDTTHKVRTVEGEGDSTLKLAFIWAGRLQYELIQPVSGFVGLYAEAVPKDRLLEFHHIAMRVDDWDGLLAGIAAQKKAIALQGEVGPIRFLYVDARDTLGHYLEYVSGPPEYWASFPS